MKKSAIMLVAIVSFVATSSQGSGQVAKIIGIAKTLHSTYSGLMGSVTVTPAYALGYYDKDFTQYYGQSYYSTGKHVSRDLITGDFDYLTWGRDAYGNYWQNEDSFTVPPLERSNYYCNMSSGPNLFIIMDTIDFRVDSWVESISKTGYWPIDGPYKTVLKSQATRIQQNCQSTVSGGQLVHRPIK